MLNHVEWSHGYVDRLPFAPQLRLLQRLDRMAASALARQGMRDNLGRLHLSERCTFAASLETRLFTGRFEQRTRLLAQAIGRWWFAGIAAVLARLRRQLLNPRSQIHHLRRQRFHLLQ